MPKTLNMYLLGALVMCGLSCSNHLTGAPVKAQLDRVFSNFVQRNDFYGGQLGVLQGSRMIYAEARGSFHGKRATPSDLTPILDLSKTITAVATLQLIERGVINLDSKIFGPQGILGYMTPPQNGTRDPRLHDITVEHLLRHCAGWDETARPLFDPLMNKPLRTLGYAVPDIAREIGSSDDYLDQYGIIYYMVGQPLQYSPGERVVHSNLGYSILGRVIEEVSGLLYEDYVKDNILVPAGMWHTKIGQPQSSNSKRSKNSKAKPKYRVKQAYSSVTPQMLDSTLGWHSNVYDIARFFTALYGTGDNQILRQATLEYALGQNTELIKHHSLKWPSLGLSVNHDGSLTLEASDRKTGVGVFFYKEPMPQSLGDDQLDAYLKEANTAVIFIGYTNAYKKHMYGLHDSILSLNLHLINQNAYIRDLCDTELTTSNSQVLIKTQLDEHKLVAYSNAMRQAGYSPRWLHAYNQNGHTYFMAIFERASESIQLYYKLIKSPSRAKLYRFISQNSKDGYHVNYLQSFLSASHNNHMVHFVLMRRSEDPPLTMFNFATNLETYDAELPYHLAEGYSVAAQSIQRYQRQTSVSYILQMSMSNNEIPETRSFSALTVNELQNTNAQLKNEKYYLSYLDTFEEHGQAKFSAVFQHNEPSQNSVFQSDIPADLFLSEAYDKSGQDYLPKVAAAYTKDNVLYFAVQWSK